MATECYSQLGFGFQPKLVVDFAGGTLTTDAGLLLVREFDAFIEKHESGGINTGREVAPGGPGRRDISAILLRRAYRFF